MAHAGCRFLVATLLCLHLLSGDVRAQDGTVTWQLGIFGVSEDAGSVEVCAEYQTAVEGFSLETSTTEVFATNGTDFLSQIGPTALLTWEANSTLACVSIPIIDDNIVENDEIFYVNIVRIVSDPLNAIPALPLQAIVMIMDDDLLPVVFTADTVTVTDDAPSVEVCVEIDGDLVADNVGYRVPIAVETVGGTAEPDVDFETFNNMTVGDLSKAVLTPPRPSHCFSIPILTRQDNSLDDRSFFASVLLRDGTAMVVPSAEQIQLPEIGLEVIVQPAAQIEVGSITDTILSNPLFSVSLDMAGGDSDSNLCYEISGDPGTFLNLVSDACFSINARYEVIEGATFYNKIDQLLITASDAAEGCSDITIDSAHLCTSATLVSGGEMRELSERYRRNGLQIEFIDGSIEVTLPCPRYPGGGIKVVAKCKQEYQHPVTDEIVPVKNLELTFYRGKLESSAYPMPHGLLGQFWRLDFIQEQFTENFVDGRSRSTAFKMTTPSDLGLRSFIGLQFHLTWDLRSENCVYVGTNQGGSVPYVETVRDSVIEGEYTDYAVTNAFDTEFAFSVFSRSDFGCPSV